MLHFDIGRHSIPVGLATTVTCLGPGMVNFVCWRSDERGYERLYTGVVLCRRAGAAQWRNFSLEEHSRPQQGL